MFDSIKKNNILKTTLILLVIIFSIVSLYSPLLKINFSGGDNLEWYQEAQERNTVAKAFDFKYSSGRLGPSAYFNPVQLIVWQYMTANYGQQPYPYHILSILTHIANVILAFFLINKFIKNKFFSFLTALSFGVCYLNFQTIGWIAASITWGLATFFILTTLLSAIMYFQTKNTFFYFLSLLTFFIGTFAKETVIFIIPILATYYIIIQREKIFGFIKNDLIIFPYLVLSLPIILITFIRLNSSALTNNWGGFNFGIHMFYRFLDFFTYLITIVPLSFGFQIMATILVLLFSPVLIYFGLKNKKLLFLFIWLISLILIYVYSNFRDVYSLSRYLYLPSIVWFALLYYIVANIKNLKLKILSSFLLINYTIIFNLFLILIKK